MPNKTTILKKDTFQFDSNGQPPIHQASFVQDESGIRQAVFSERIRSILLTHTLQATVKQLKTQPKLLAEPTAQVVTQHLLLVYSHLKPDSKFLVTPDIAKWQLHVQDTVVKTAIEDPKISGKFIDQAVQSTCGWFSKCLEDRLGLGPGSLLTDAQLTQELDQFLDHPEDTLSSPKAYLNHMCSQALAQCLIETLESSSRTAKPSDLESILGLVPSHTPPKLPTSQDMLEVMNASHYHAMRDVLSRKLFGKSEESQWPTAVLDKGSAKGYAELRPAVLDTTALISPEEEKLLVERMWKQREELSDIDADALDALSSIWLRQAKNSEQDAIAGIDEILEMRGIQPKKGGQGRRGGYMPEQRLEILNALSHIQSLWMHMNEMEIYETSGPKKGRSKKIAIQSRAFTITDLLGQLHLDGRMDVSQFIFRPGKVFANFLFGIGRQTALLSAQALKYNPYNQAPEKRMARYLSWQWRCQASNGCGPKIYRVSTLLDVIGEPPNLRRPGRSRDRLEKLFDVLLKDQIVAGWQYERWHEDSALQQGWFDDWLTSTIILEPPASIQEKYVALTKKEELPPKVSLEQAIGERIRLRRLELRLSQAQLADALGMHQTAINRLERGQRHGTKATLQKLEQWLTQSY